MTQVSFHDRDGVVIRPPASGAQATAALWELGIQSGHWTLQTQPVSRTPQLTYARELHQLQQRCDSVYTDRVRQRPHEQRADPRDHHSIAWPDQREEHIHHDAEVRVLLDGRARWVVRAPAAGGWVAVVCEAGDWLSLPAGMPHSFEASPSLGVELFRLFSRPGGWVAERTAAKVPARLARWDEGLLELQAPPVWAEAA